MKKIYYLQVKKGSVPSSRYDYPCEAIGNDFLSGRNIYVYGTDGALKKSIMSELKGYKCSFADGVEDISDMIIVHSGYSSQDNNPELYFKELYYYHDEVFKAFQENKGNLRNVIFLLPYNSDIASTNYKQMADYGTLCYSQGLSAVHSIREIYTYSLLVKEDIKADELIDTLLYCLSKNSDHFVAKTIKIG